MATEVERAIIELQVLFRDMDRRLAALEREKGPPAMGRHGEDSAASKEARGDVGRVADISPIGGMPVDPTVINQAGDSAALAEPAPVAEGTAISVSSPPPVASPATIPTPPPVVGTPVPANLGMPADGVGAPFTELPSARTERLLREIAGKQDERRESIENQIGQSVMSAVGGLVLLGGILFFLRYTFTASWLGPGVRVGYAAGAGVALLGLGQWLHHLKMRPLAAAITATGLAALLVTLLAANVGYSPAVLQRYDALGGMVVVGATGIFLGLWMGMESLAVLGMVGMYVGPLAMTFPPEQAIGVMGYLSGVSVAGLVLCRVRPNWQRLRLVGFLALAMPLYFAEVATGFGWALLALALATYAVAFNSRHARVASFVALGLWALRILFFDSMVEALKPVLFTFGYGTMAVAVTPWTLLGWGAAVYSLPLAYVSRPRVGAPRGANEITVPQGAAWSVVACAIVGTVLWCAVAINRMDVGYALTLAVLAWIFVLIGLSRVTFSREDASHLESVAAVLLTGVCVKWVCFDGLALVTSGPGMYQAADFESGNLVHSGWALPVVNVFILSGLLIVGAFRAMRVLQDLGREFLGWFVTTLAFVAMNVEAIRAVDEITRALGSTVAAGGVLAEPWLVKNVVMSILWGVFAFGMISVGFVRKYPPARWMALSLLGVTVGKVFIVDMANVDTALRALSFVILGGLLLAVSYLYHRSAHEGAPCSPRKKNARFPFVGV